MSRFIACVAMFSLTACASGARIVDRPISFSPERQELTKQYLQDRYGIAASDITIEPKMIVLHWTAISGLEPSFRAFDRERLASSRPDLKNAGDVNISIQFLVDRDGTIFRLMPETWMARHVIGLNHVAIGVENIGGTTNGGDDLTDEQIRANIELVKYLKKKYPGIEYLIGHHEYTQFEQHPLWRERDPNYRTKKIDPGDRFMSAVRNAVAGLDLKGPPTAVTQ